MMRKLMSLRLPRTFKSVTESLAENVHEHDRDYTTRQKSVSIPLYEKTLRYLLAGFNVHPLVLECWGFCFISTWEKQECRLFLI